MSVCQHHCVIATTSNLEHYNLVYDWIKELDWRWQKLFVDGQGLANDSMTIVMIPDGSNEGWDLSNNADSLRHHFILQLKELNIEYVEVTFGEQGTGIVETK